MLTICIIPQSEFIIFKEKVKGNNDFYAENDNKESVEILCFVFSENVTSSTQVAFFIVWKLICKIFARVISSYFCNVKSVC
jgi:hypothetical protein